MCVCVCMRVHVHVCVCACVHGCMNVCTPTQGSRINVLYCTVGTYECTTYIPLGLRIGEHGLVGFLVLVKVQMLSKEVGP